MDLRKGTKIYYTGDMANSDGLGKIANRYQNQWGDFVDVELDDGRKMNCLYANSFSDEYNGHKGTKFVTKKAYLKWKEEMSKRWYKKYLKK